MTTPQRERNSDGSFSKKEPEDDNKQVQAHEPTLADIMSTVQALMAENDRKNKEIEALKKSVDQNTYNASLADQMKDERRTLKLRMVNGQPLKSWSNMITNEAYVHEGKHIEDQTTEITFLDDTKLVVTYETAFNTITYTPLLPINAVTTKGKETFYEIEWQGKTYNIEQTFIN